MYEEPKEYINMEDCKDGYLYKIYSRNLSYGVYKEETKEFYGIRTKFGSRYVFPEDHWDTGAPHGTVKPIEKLEQCPSSELETTEKLFNWLERKEIQYEARTMRGVREYAFSANVILQPGMRIYNMGNNEERFINRWLIVTEEKADLCGIQIDLHDLIKWLKENKPELLQ